MDNIEMLDKLKSVINHLIKDNPEDPDNAAAGHADAAQQDLHDVITAKMRERVVGTQTAPPDLPSVGDDEETSPPVAPEAATSDTE